jgi:hypothetical protein
LFGVGSPEAGSVVERLRYLANNPDPRIVGGSLKREQARALLAVVEAAQEFYRLHRMVDASGPLTFDVAALIAADQRMRAALERVHTPDSAEEPDG